MNCFHVNGQYGFHDGNKFVALQESLTANQIDTLVNKLAEKLAAPEDVEFFKFVYRLAAEKMSPTSFLEFCAKSVEETLPCV